MTKTELELAGACGKCGLTLVHEKGQPYHVRTFDGVTVGPFRSASHLRAWLAGYSVGMHQHEPGCQCGRVACNFRNAMGGE